MSILPEGTYILNNGPKKKGNRWGGGRMTQNDIKALLLQYFPYLHITDVPTLAEYAIVPEGETRVGAKLAQRNSLLTMSERVFSMDRVWAHIPDSHWQTPTYTGDHGMMTAAMPSTYEISSWNNHTYPSTFSTTPHWQPLPLPDTSQGTTTQVARTSYGSQQQSQVFGEQPPIYQPDAKNSLSSAWNMGSANNDAPSMLPPPVPQNSARRVTTPQSAVNLFSPPTQSFYQQGDFYAQGTDERTPQHNANTMTKSPGRQYIFRTNEPIESSPQTLTVPTDSLSESGWGASEVNRSRLSKSLLALPPRAQVTYKFQAPIPSTAAFATPSPMVQQEPPTLPSVSPTGLPTAATTIPIPSLSARSKEALARGNQILNRLNSQG
jgi:hypothetical protein